ncbi:2Fe-2S iron-sulfur cluster-binding protein [Sulfurospirillum sp. 1307]|jgi:NADH-quinone oxidoreductase subunit G
MATITVDDKQIEAKEGALLIEELLANGIEIPHFCYHPALGKDGNCRMCMVEIEGKKRPQIACDTPVKDGMVIRTKGDGIDRVKRQILEMELINHPVDCPICDQAGECSLQNYYMDVGLYESRLNTPKTRGMKHVDIGANVVLDQERCVLCTRCVRFTSKITKTKELGVEHRADHSVITTFPGKPLSNPYAMNVVDLCPVGALTNKDFRFKKRVWFLEPEEGICNRCSKGCNIYIDHHKAKYEDDNIFRYRPRHNDMINGYFICDEGRLSYKKENENRKSYALIRGKESEYEYATSKFVRLLKRYHGKILFLISPSLSLEEMMRLKKLSEKFNGILCGYDTKEYDKEFGDEFLKCNDLSTNRRGFRILKIDENKETIDNFSNNGSLLVCVGREDLESIENIDRFEAKILLNASMPSNFEDWDLFVPYKTHTSRSGSFINIDGYLQYHKSNVEYPNETKELNQIIAESVEDGVSTCKEIWESGLSEALGNISLEDFQKQSFKMSI